MTSSTPRRPSFHPDGLGLGIGHCDCRSGRCQAECSRQSRKRKSLSARDCSRSEIFTHVDPPGFGEEISCTHPARPSVDPDQLKPSSMFRLRQFNQHSLPIDLHHYARIAIELLASTYPKRSSSENVMPMCQSPKIADVLLRTRGFPANDNCAPVQVGMKCLESEGTFRVACRTFRHRVRVHLGHLTSFAMSRADATRLKKTPIPRAWH